MTSYYETRVAGVSFRQSSMKKVVEGHKLILISEPTNKYDPNAIMVCLGDTEDQIGYIPKSEAPDVKKLLEEGKVKGCKVLFVGRPGPRKPIGCRIAIEVDE